jgi:WS/DGAT/MGAT family acyltransferase
MRDYAYDRLTQLDNSFLVYEGPDSPMHVGIVQIYEAAPLRHSDGTLDFERLKDYVHSRLHRIPRYRHRLIYTPVEGHPVWIDDDHFNIRYHVRHTRLPSPGSERMLKRLAGRILSQQLDRGKPLWEMWLIEGLEKDRVATITKTHHCMIDGIAGVDLLAELMSGEPSETVDPTPEWLPRPAPSPAQLLRSELLRRAEAPLQAASSLWRLAREGEQSRNELIERLLATGRVLSSGVRWASNTPINQRIGPHRRIDWLPMDLNEFRAVKSKLGGTVNDVILATVAGAVRRFLGQRRRVRMEDLEFRVLAPVSMRAPNQRGESGNRVSAWIVKLPVGEADPRRRYELVCRTTAELKSSRQALGAETLTRLTEWVGSTVFSLGSRLMSAGQPFNMVVTNVPGPRTPLYLMGARMLQGYPLLPLMANLSSGIALFSYRNTLSWAVIADWDLVPDLHDFLLDLETSFQELHALV